MRGKFLFIILIGLLFITACSKDEEQANKNSEKKNGLGEKEIVMDDTYPLTGLETNEGANNRIVSVMVNNHPQARPQSGLSKADIVFEILAEGDITRFLALFQSEEPDVVGPVRSAREYYFELANGYDALYVYHGAANFVNDMIQNRSIENLNGAIYDNDGNLFKRESFRKAPHNSYLQYDAVYDVAEEKGYDIIHTYEALPFLTEEETVEGEDAKHIQVTYPGRSELNVVEFKYDEQSEKFTRYENQDQTIELNSEESIEVDNVFIIETYHEVIDSEGRRAIDLEAGGDAYLIQKGKLQRLQWENKNGRIVPVKDGQPIGFVPGKSWINVVPSSPGIEQSVQLLGE